VQSMRNYFLNTRKIVAAGLLLLLSAALGAQEKLASRLALEVETTFKRGVEVFNAGRHEESLAIFDVLLQANAKHPRVAAALYMKARCGYHLNRFEMARAAIDDLERNYPKSTYVPHGHVLLGMIAFHKDEPLEAAVEFLWIVETGRAFALRHQAAEWARPVLEDYLPITDLRRLRKSYTGPKGAMLVALALARDEMALGNRDAGEKIIDESLRTNLDPALRKEFEQLRRTGGETVAAVLRLGIVLPLTGIDTEAGMGIYRGLKYAQLTGANNNGGPTIEFVVRDSESNLLRALKVTQDLLEDQTIVAIIGEVDNATTGAMAALANAKGVPFIAPVATENGIGRLGENVFQLNADRERKARALAEYAFTYLNAKTFVTLAPQDDYGQQMADGFSAAVDSLGGEIFAQKWYYGEPQDLGRIFKSIRMAAFRRAYKDSLKLKLFPAGTNPKQMDPEEVNIPVTNLNAIFMPLPAEDIRLVAGQRAYFNFQSAIMGGENWYLTDLAKNKELQRYVEGTIFASDYFIDPESARYKQFRNDFRVRMGATPEKWEIFGYDTANLLFKAIQQGGSSRLQLRQALAQMETFIGMKGEINLRNSENVNSKVNILQIRNGQIVKLR